MLTENAADLTEVMVYFEDDLLTGITIPKVKRAAAELPRGQIKDKQWPGFINAQIKEWAGILVLIVVAVIKPPEAEQVRAATPDRVINRNTSTE